MEVEVEVEGGGGVVVAVVVVVVAVEAMVGVGVAADLQDEDKEDSSLERCASSRTEAPIAPLPVGGGGRYAAAPYSSSKPDAARALRDERGDDRRRRLDVDRRRSARCRCRPGCRGRRWGGEWKWWWRRWRW